MPFAAALSEHPVAASATGEVVGSVLEALGTEPDLAVVFVTPPHAGALEDVAGAVATLLQPATLLGCAGVSVVGGPREVEEVPGVSLWAARFGADARSPVPPVVGVRLDARPGPEGPVVAGFPEELPFSPSALVLLADPFSFPVDAFFARLAEDHPGLPVVGGMASAARGPGGNRLVLGNRVVTSGAVGALLGPEANVATVVSQGCRPVGRPLVVTRAEGNVVHEMAGEPPLRRLEQLAASASPEDVALLGQGLHLGRVIDEHRAEFDRGDFLVRGVLGGDRRTGAIAVGDEIELGTTVQFHVRDAETADEDLRTLLAGEEADAALVFTCNGRGTHLFGVPDHDAGVLDAAFGGVPTAGFFAAGEFGPVGRANFLHGFTASVALFRESEPKQASSPSG